MKILYLGLVLLFISLHGNSQSFNNEKVKFMNFLKRMYISKPFEGVKIVDDYDHQYLISFISLEKAKYAKESIMNRVAQVNAQFQTSTLFNGATISMDMLITTRESSDKMSNNKIIIETVEHRKQKSIEFSKGLYYLQILIILIILR